MDYICGTVDFHKTSDLIRVFKPEDTDCLSVFADEQVILCRMYNPEKTESHIFADEKMAIVSIGKPFSDACSCVVYDKISNEIRFFSSAGYPFFYVFSGTEFVFSSKASVLQSMLAFKKCLPESITQLKPGLCGCFSRKGLSVY